MYVLNVGNHLVGQITRISTHVQILTVISNGMVKPLYKKISKSLTGFVSYYEGHY